MVKVTALFNDGSRFERVYPDSFMADAQRMNAQGRRGSEIVAALIQNDWREPPLFVDVIKDEGMPGATSLRLW